MSASQPFGLLVCAHVNTQHQSVVHFCSNNEHAPLPSKYCIIWTPFNYWSNSVQILVQYAFLGLQVIISALLRKKGCILLMLI